MSGTDPAGEPFVPRQLPAPAYLIGLGVGTLGVLTLFIPLWIHAIPDAVLPAAVTSILALALLGGLYVVVLRRIRPTIVLVPVFAVALFTVLTVGLIITITIGALSGVVD